MKNMKKRTHKIMFGLVIAIIAAVLLATASVSIMAKTADDDTISEVISDEMKDCQRGIHQYRILYYDDGDCVTKSYVMCTCDICNDTYVAEGEYGEHEWKLVKQEPVLDCQPNGKDHWFIFFPLLLCVLFLYLIIIDQ